MVQTSSEAGEEAREEAPARRRLARGTLRSRSTHFAMRLIDGLESPVRVTGRHHPLIADAAGVPPESCRICCITASAVGGQLRPSAGATILPAGPSPYPVVRANLP